ncbi:uncharacterized protein LOC62_01G001524 [Vanrija pseudolonga]|uniref:Uncharacterized protein n=1 Tax=Vanrija pseudolonga TaxID=143232 RepID=A0AAF0Y247_9TREE|nr:hypothetical protein LOC62_01G001524 [Vanrija pseudolonga]
MPSRFTLPLPQPLPRPVRRRRPIVPSSLPPDVETTNTVSDTMTAVRAPIEAEDPTTPLTPERHAYNIPHILEAIVSYTDHNTRVTLLRTRKELHRLAAPYIYRHLSIGEDTGRFFGMLKGIMVGAPFQGNVPSHYVDCCRLINGMFDGQPIHCPKGLGDLPFKEAERLGFDVTFGTKDSHFEPYRTNFKRPLLEYTETLTIGTHHSCSCAIFAEYLGDLFPNIKILRVAPTNHSTPLPELCCQRRIACPKADITPCPLLTKLKPHKIVLRNVDDRGFCFPNDFLWDVKDVEVVIFLQVNDGEFSNPIRLFLCLTAHFPSIAEVKVVFMGQHEGQADNVGQRQPAGNRLVGADEVIGALNSLALGFDDPEAIYRRAGLGVELCGR